MINRHRYKNIAWIDIESPKEDELVPLIKEFGLSPIILEELLRPSERAKVDSYLNFIYLILHFPKYKHGQNKECPQEIDFVIGKNFIITSHYEPVEVFFGLSKLLETKSIIDKSENTENSGFIFYHIMKKLYDNIAHELDHVTKELTSVEKEIFSGNEHKMVQALSKLSKILIDFKHPLRLHSEILESFDSKEEKIFGEKYQHYTDIIIGDYKRVWNIIESNRELFMDLRETNDSLFSAKMNNIMKNLTIMSFLTFPLSLMTGIFGMNTSQTPLAGLENGFWIILAIMGITTLSIIIFLVSKKWI